MRRATFIVVIALSACSGEPEETTTGGGPAPASDAGADGGQEPDLGMASMDVGGPDGGMVDADADAGMDAGTPGTALDIPGLSGEVVVRFDAEDVVHISCSVDTDCVAAQGYVTASHRFGQMDLRRRATSGRLTELFSAIGFGSLTYAADRRARLVFRTRDGSQSIASQLLAAASPRTRAFYDAYAEGVNAWIRDFEDGGGQVPLSVDWAAFSNRLEPWTAEDSLSVILLLMEGLTNSGSRDLAYGAAALSLEPAALADLLSLAPATTTTIIPQIEPTAQVDRDRLLRSAESMRDFLSPHAALLGAAGAKRPARDLSAVGVGSNSWAVAPSAAAGTAALLANDPHLDMSNPSTWYIVNIDAGEGGVHIAGASFAGLPGVVLGQNRNIAWGSTNSFFDQSDVYIETLSQDGTGVVFNGQTVPFEEVRLTVTGPDGDPIEETLLFVPHHGPVIDLDPMAGSAVTLRWTAQDADTDIEFLTDMWFASNMDEARAALRKVTTLGQNFTVIDDQGNIAWLPYNRVPRRPWASSAGGSAPWAPLIGDGSREWDGFHDLDDLPQLLNPGRGIIATANNDMTGNLLDGDPTNDGFLEDGTLIYWQNFLATGYRAKRIEERLDELSGTLDPESMRALAGDVKVLLAEDIVPRVLEISDANDGLLTAAGRSVREALRGWNFECPTGLAGITPDAAASADAGEVAAASACSAFHVLWSRLGAAAVADEAVAAGLPRFPVASFLVRLLLTPQALVGGDAYFDDVTTPDTTETITDAVVGALNRSGAFLQERFSADPSTWLWGRLHVVRPDADDGRGFATRPYANDGGWHTVDVANPSRSIFNVASQTLRDDYGHGAGPSMRLVCEGTTPVACSVDLPGSQRFLQTSDVQRPELLERWVRNEAFPIRFSAAAVAAAEVMEERLVFSASE